ncbi:MAG: acyltransferase family protein [Geminicoccaceae bacterium]
MSPSLLRHGKSIEIQWLRGLAATFVLLYHTSLYQSVIQKVDKSLLIFNPLFGWYGVAIFFAISGYLIAQLVRRQKPARFMLHRVVRIYPVYLLVAGVVVVDAWFAGRGIPQLAVFSLVPAGRLSYPLTVEWTLVFEITYYVILCLLAVSGLVRWLDWIAAAWLATVVAIAFTALEPDGQTLFPLWLMPLAAANIPFAAGLLLPRLIALGLNPILLLTASAALFFQGLWATAWHEKQLATALSAALLVAVAADFAAAAPGGRSERLETWMSSYGDTSYALYLCHVPIILLVYLHLTPVSPWLAWSLAVVLALLVAIPLGMLDKRLYGRLRRMVDLLPTFSARMAATAYIGLFVLVAASAALMGADASRSDARSNDTAMAGQTASLEGGRDNAPEAISGIVDSITWLGPRTVHVTGWAGNRTDVGARVRIGVLARGKLVATGERTIVRPDVAASLDIQVWNTRPVGFDFTAALACVPDEAYLVVAIADDGHTVPLAAPLGWPPCPSRDPPSR